MQRLRSRWTVVALVPAVFLAGFGIVSALADDADDAAPATAAAADEPGAPGPSTVTPTAEASPGATTEAAEPATTAETGGAARATTDGSGAGGGGGGGGGGGAPPSPPAGEIAVDYGPWEGVFTLENLELQPAGDETVAFGELHYLGGLDCPVGLVRVKTWLYAGGGIVGQTQWESVESTGEGGEVTGREPLPFEARAAVERSADAAALRFTAAECL
jgi:hypothetical protein